MKRAPLSRGAYKCLKVIKSYDFMKRGWSCPSHETLAKDLHVSERQIKRYVAELTQKSYVFPKRRPNSSSLYYFGCEKRQNVPTKGTENVPTDVPTDVPTIQLFLMPPKGLPSKPALKEHTPVSEMPDYYRTEPEQKLWRMAQRWIALNNPDLSAVSGDKARPIMYALEASGALEMPEDGPLPMIAWPELNAVTPLVKLAQAIERKPVRSLSQADYEFLRLKIGPTE